MITRRSLEHCISINDVRQMAKRRLPRQVFEIIEGGNGDEFTLRDNIDAYRRINLYPKGFATNGEVDTSTTVLGSRLSSPIILGPCSFLRACHPEGELAVARAAARTATVYVVPGGAGHDPATVAKEVNGADLWYQIYLRPDQRANEERVRSIANAGYKTLIVTIDTPGKPFRERDLRNGINTPTRLSPRVLALGLTKPAWALGFVAGNRADGFRFEARQQYLRFADVISSLKPVTLSEFRWLRAEWSGKLIVKGVLRADDVDEFIAEGADGIVVSNHGARNLDTTPATIDVLPHVCAQANGRVPVLVDGGIRRGSDIVKAIALGASAVLIGRPYLYGLCAAGSPGVEHAWRLLADDFQRTLYFLGLRSVDELDARTLGRAAKEPTGNSQNEYESIGGFR